MANIVTINAIAEINGKWANFVYDKNKTVWAKYGYYSYLVYSACFDQFGDKPELPIKARVDSLENFIVEAIYHRGVWVKLKPRGY